MNDSPNPSAMHPALKGAAVLVGGMTVAPCVACGASYADAADGEDWVIRNPLHESAPGLTVYGTCGACAKTHQLVENPLTGLVEAVRKKGQMRTREQAIANAGKAYAEVRATCASMTPREQAEAAWSPTSRLTVDELEDRIRARRGMTPLNREKEVK